MIDNRIHCVDCGVAIISGQRCAMHARAHRFKLMARSSHVSGKHFRSIPPSRIEIQFATDLADGFSVHDIMNHRGVGAHEIAGALKNLRNWLRAGDQDPVSKFAALAIDRALENYSLRVVSKTVDAEL